MIDPSNNIGRGDPSADPVRFLRRLIGREPSARQSARIRDIREKFHLQAGDSIFIVIAILEVYLHQVEGACLDLRRSTRKILRTACITAVFGAAVMITPLYLLDPHVRLVLGWKSEPASDGKTRNGRLPLRAYVDATLDQMSDDELIKLATSNDAMAVLRALPRLSDEQRARIREYVVKSFPPAPQ